MASQLRRAFVGFRILFTHKENPSFFSVKRFYGEKPCPQDSKQIRGAFMGNPFFLSVKRFYGEKPCPQDSKQVLRKPLDDKAATEVAVAVPDSPTKDSGSEEEPTAASLVHDLENTDTDKISATMRVLLLDDYLCVSLLAFFDPAADYPEELCNLVVPLGADLLVKRIVDWLVSNFKRDKGIDLSKEKRALVRITEAAKNAIMNLSFLTTANISLSFKTADGRKHRICTSLSRTEFENLCSDLLDMVKIPVDKSFRIAEQSSVVIERVLFEPESTCIPVFCDILKKSTGMYPYEILSCDGVSNGAISSERFWL